MQRSFRMTLAVSAAALALSLGAARAQETIKIGTEGAYPPFNNLTADGKLEGFDIDIAKALCDEMKAKCEFVTQDWDGIIPALQAGKFDAIVASMSITDERKQKVDFTDKYYNTPPAIVAPKDTAIKGVTKADLAGKTIGVQGATTHFNYAEKTYTDSEIKLYPSARGISSSTSPMAASTPSTTTSSCLQQWLDTAGRRLLQDRRHDPAGRSRSTVRAPASPCARATTRCASSSTPPSRPFAPTASTRKSTTSTSSSTFTAASPPDPLLGRGGEALITPAALPG